MNAFDKAITAMEELEKEIGNNHAIDLADSKKVLGTLYTARAVLETYKTKILKTTYTMRITYADNYIVERQTGTEPRRTVASSLSEGEAITVKNALNTRSTK